MRPIDIVPRQRISRRLIVVAMLVSLLLLFPVLALAHPLGNFSINHYSGIEVRGDAIAVCYVIDMAEIPTFQELQGSGITPQDNHSSLSSYLSRKVEELKQGLVLTVNGSRMGLSTEGQEITFPPGVGGLPTMKIGARFSAQLDPARLPALNQVLYQDTNFHGRAGWKEIVVVGTSATSLQNSSASTIGRSKELSSYPTDLLNSPPQDLEARFAFEMEGVRGLVASTEQGLPAVASGASQREKTLSSDRLTQPVERISQPQSRGASKWDLAFMQLITVEEVGLGVMLLSLVLSFSLGAFHALEPGHGKTIVGAYLVGSRGTARHALLLGLIVTATHTAGVYLVGLVTLNLSKYILPEQLYPWLGLLSGMAIVGMGLYIFSRHYRRLFSGGSGPSTPHHLHHDHGHHHPHAHAHPHQNQEPGAVTYRELFALGITGGIIPCPAAMVVLLSAISLGRIGFGLLLIVAFSAGLALVLMAIGLLMVYARWFMGRFKGNGLLVTRWLPMTSAAVITLFGVAIAVQALMSTGMV